MMYLVNIAKICSYLNSNIFYLTNIFNEKSFYHYFGWRRERMSLENDRIGNSGTTKTCLL